MVILLIRKWWWKQWNDSIHWTVHRRKFNYVIVPGVDVASGITPGYPRMTLEHCCTWWTVQGCGEERASAKKTFKTIYSVWLEQLLSSLPLNASRLGAEAVCSGRVRIPQAHWWGEGVSEVVRTTEWDNESEIVSSCCGRSEVQILW